MGARQIPSARGLPSAAKRLEVSLAEVARWFDGEDTTVPNGLSVPAWLGHFASLEQGASRIWTYEPMVVPGLLQTEAYATAVERREPDPLTDEDIARRVEVRLARQAVLERPGDPLRLTAVVDESVLLRTFGDPAVQAEQLDHLVAISARDNVDIRVVPLAGGASAACWGSFSVLTSPGSTEPYMVCTEDRTGVNYLDKGHQVATHIGLFEHVTEVALSPAASLELIRSTAKEHHRSCPIAL
jgi:hypothetical protein